MLLRTTKDSLAINSFIINIKSPFILVFMAKLVNKCTCRNALSKSFGFAGKITANDDCLALHITAYAFSELCVNPFQSLSVSFSLSCGFADEIKTKYLNKHNYIFMCATVSMCGRAAGEGGTNQVKKKRLHVLSGAGGGADIRILKILYR